jgi:hypothetical protein
LYYFSETKNIIASFAKQPGLIMNKNQLLLFAFVLLLFMGAGSFMTSAQDAGSPSFEAYEKDPAERVFFSPGDSSTLTRSSKKDSVLTSLPVKRNVYKPAPVVPKEKASENPNDNSVLSFNFLYYLIQKYKMQDIVD